MLEDLYKGKVINMVKQNIDNILPQQEFLQGFDLTLGINVESLPKTLSNNIILISIITQKQRKQ